jgi:hypothetical protein
MQRNLKQIKTLDPTIKCRLMLKTIIKLKVGSAPLVLTGGMSSMLLRNLARVIGPDRGVSRTLMTLLKCPPNLFTTTHSRE